VPISRRARAARNLLALAAALALAALVPSASQAMTLMTQDANAFEDPPSALTGPAYEQAGHAGASMIRGLLPRDGNLAIDDDQHPSWDGYDRFVDTTRARDFEPYLTLTYKPHDWSGGPTLRMPSTQDFAYFCRRAAAHFQGRVRHYSVWNEPNYFRIPDANGVLTTVPPATYGQLYRACWTEIKNVDPTAKVYFGELAGGNCNYLSTAVASSQTKADGFAIHPYQWQLPPTQPTGNPCSGIGRLGDFTASLSSTWLAGTFRTQAGGQVPLMVTEFGTCVAGGGCPDGPHTLTEAQRADWIGQAYDHAVASGVSLFSYYHLVKTGSGWDSGIVNQDGAATPSVQALHDATGVQAPTVVTGAASNLSARAATLNATVDPNGIRTTYRFEYGETTDYGASAPVPDGSAGSGTGSIAVSQPVGGLLPGRTYHYRVVATSRVGTTRGSDQTFVTPRPSFTGDGKADLAIAEPTVNAFLVATSTGTALGGPGSQQWLSGWNTSPEWARAGDFNGDGTTDMIMADPIAGTYTVALSDGTILGAAGSGTWLTSWGGRPEWVEVGDFNGDGKDDLVGTDSANNLIRVALSDGRSLTAAGSGSWMTAWGGARPGWADVGDFDGNGKDDLIIADPVNNVFAVALSDGSALNGAGNWITGWSGSPTWARIGDFNGDGKDDLIGAGGPTSFVVGISDGTRLQAGGTGIWLTGWSSNPVFADVADFNGDGKDDLIGAGANDTYAVALSDGSALNSGGTWLTGWDSTPQWAAAGDFSGDAKADFVLANPAANAFQVATSTGSALGGPGSQQWLIGWDTSPDWARPGDVDRDGKTDVVMADPIAGAYTVALSSGSHLGASGSGTWLTGWGGRPDWAEVGDFDGDGRDDVIGNNPEAGNISVALSDGRSLRAPGSGAWMTSWGGARPTWADVGDFNGDGKTDLIMADPVNETYAVALSDGTQLNGSGWWLTGWSGRPDWADVGDFNGDGKDDLITNNPDARSIVVALSDGRSLRASGSGTWMTSWGGARPTWADVGDVNGDGKDDLISADPVNGTYAVALSDGRQFNGSGWWLTGWGGSPFWAAAG
jgi:FG-GAP-like repeat